jgi:DNA topoisomerase-1
MIDFLEAVADLNTGNNLIYNCSQPVKVLKKAPEPFTTSRLQQVASNELHYSPKETMRVCQILYEGGYITYMRTDSKTYSGEFIETVKTYITRTYAQGDKYISENIDTMSTGCVKENAVKKKTKKETAKPIKDTICQEAHEAIRPTNISLFELPEPMDPKREDCIN